MNGYDNNRPGQPQKYQPEFDDREYYVPVSHNLKSRNSKINTGFVIALIVLGVFSFMIMALILFFIAQTDTSVTDTDAILTREDTEVSITEEAVKDSGDYVVRESPFNRESQVGAYDSYVEACKKAKEYKYDDYEVYDNYGNMIYTPVDNIENPTSAQVKYRVRKGSYDSKSQIGAFANYSKALECVKSRADEGYKIFDMNGIIVYDPYTAIR